MITVTRKPITWVIEIESQEPWPVVANAFQRSFRMRPTRVSLTVDEDDLFRPHQFLDVRAGRRVRQDGTEGARLGTQVPHTVLIKEMPETVQRAVQQGLDTARGEARNLGLIKEES